jgi:hypothetical protein
MFRFAWVGVALAVLGRWTRLSVTLTAISFVTVFVALQAYSLYQYATGRGPFESRSESCGAVGMSC